MSETCHHILSAINACSMLVFFISAKLKCLIDYRCKIFIFPDMHHLWI